MLKKNSRFSSFPLPACDTAVSHAHSRFLPFSFCSTVSDLQEEGKNAINSPLSPAAVDLHPEETLLGTVGPALSLSWDSCAPVARTWPQRGVTATAF